MPARETYLLHIYRNRAVRGWQWAARLEHLPDGASVRFADPEALLAHLRQLMWTVEGVAAPPNVPRGEGAAGKEPGEGGRPENG
jgi:hypothetical protein